MKTAEALLLGAAAELAIEVSPAQVRSLVGYLDLLQRWNRTYNLTAVRSAEEMLTHHLFDCLSIVKPIHSMLCGAPKRILDVGSGAGLPGVMLAIMFPTSDVVCIDAVHKKASFIKQVSLELQLHNLRGEHGRVETYRGEPFDLITSRAFSSLADFVKLTEPSLSRNGCWLAMKGQSPAEELRLLHDNVDVFHVEQLRVPALNAERCIVWMRKAGPICE